MHAYIIHTYIRTYAHIYMLASGKTQNTVALTTLKKPDGSKTANMIDTLLYMAKQLIPEDNLQDDTDHHKNIIRLIEQPIETIDDRDFRQDEVRLLKVSIPGKHQGQTESQVTF